MGDLFVADTGDSRVRVQAGATCSSSCPFGLPSTLAGNMYTIAGNGSIGASGDGGPGSSAAVWQPNGVALDSRGDVVIADTWNSRVRLVGASSCASACPYGLPSITPGYIYTIAGDGNGAFSGDGGPAKSAEINNPDGVAVDGKGDLLISDTFNNRVRFVAASSCSSACPFGLAPTTAGDIYTVAGNGGSGYLGDGGLATSTTVSAPAGVSVDSHGNLLVADAGAGRIRLVAAASCSSACPFGLQSTVVGHIYTVAGGGGGG